MRSQHAGGQPYLLRTSPAIVASEGMQGENPGSLHYTTRPLTSLPHLLPDILQKDIQSVLFNCVIFVSDLFVGSKSSGKCRNV